MRMTKLSELVQQGRLAMHAGVTVGNLGAELPVEPHREPNASAAPTPQSRPSRRADIVDKIEDLAVQLLTISKLRMADPEMVMRQALVSIDACLTSIASRH